MHIFMAFAANCIDVVGVTILLKCTQYCTHVHVPQNCKDNLCSNRCLLVLVRVFVC